MKARWLIALPVALTAAPLLCSAGTLVLKNAFIEKYKNRVTIETSFDVDHVLAKPHRVKSGGDDGDLHMAGRGDMVGLPLVVEIVNAGRNSQQAATSAAEQDDGKTVVISGAWRVWFEHPPAGNQAQTQGDPLEPFTTSNPDHVFEIHPVTSFDGAPILNSFDVIPNYTAYDAETAFSHYESLQATVTANNTGTAIESSKVGYNYAEFIIELGGKPVPSDDGGFLVLAKVFKNDEETVAEGFRRMVFAKDTPPAEQVRNAKKGDRFHVLGIPRVNLERISFAAKQQPGETFVMPLPYEMIIVGIFP